MADPGALTLGSAVVEVGADLTKLVAQFAEARRLKDQFEQDMVSGSAGLMKLTETANNAATAINAETTATKAETTATKEATDALKEQKAALDGVTTAAKENGAAIDAETARNQRLSEMVDRSIESMKQQRATMSAGTSSFLGQTVPREPGGTGQKSIPPGYLEGDVGAAAAALGTKTAAGAKDAEKALKEEAAASDALVSRSDKLLSSVSAQYAAQLKWSSALREGEALLKAEAISEAEFAMVKEAVTKGLKAAEEGEKAVGGGAHGSAGALREFIVLIREAARGDFTRMAGSASILAQRLGVLELAGPALVVGFGAVAAAAAVVGAGFLIGSNEAAQLNNTLNITRNESGLTATSFEEMAKRIAAANNTTQHSAEEVLSVFVKTGQYTAPVMEEMSEAVVKFAHLTGESVDDIAKSWSKIGDDPVKFAELLAKQYDLTTTAGKGLTANQIELARRLQESGDKMGAVKAIADGLKAGLSSQQEQVGYLTAAWRGLAGAIGGAWQRLLDWGKASTGPLAEINDKVDELKAERARLQNQVQSAAVNGNADARMSPFGQTYRQRIADIDRDLGQLAATTGRVQAAQEHLAAARGRAQAAQRETIDANNAEANTYKSMVDRTAQLRAAYADLDRRRAAANANLRRNPNDAQAKETADFYNGQYDNIRASLHKQYAPAEDKADRKAERDSESAAKKAAREAAELAKRREEAIDQLKAESQALDDELPLYKNQSASIEDINAKKRENEILTRLKLSADSAEGKQIIALIEHIKDQTKAETDLKKARDFFSAEDGKIKALQLEVQQYGQTGEAIDFETIKLRLLNEAKQKHIALTKENIALIEKQAHEEAAAATALDLKKYQAERNGGKFTPRGTDASEVDQALGGKFKLGDDLRKQAADEKRMLDQIAAARQHGVYTAQQAEERTTEAKKKGLQDRRALLVAEKELQIGGAADIAGSLASIAADSLGKQSAAYKALFAVQKAFAIAQAGIALEQAVAQAFAKGFPQNIPLIAQAVAQGAVIVSDIKSVQANFAEGGMVRGSGSGTSDDITIGVSDQEFVVNQQATLKNLPMLQDINAGREPRLRAAANDRAPSVTVHNHAPGVVVEAAPGPTVNDVVLIARRVVQSDAPGVVGRDMGRPNGETSKAMTTHFDTTRRRK